MGAWSKFRDSVLKPVAGIALAPYTGGASLAIVGNDLASRNQRKLADQQRAEQDRLKKEAEDFAAAEAEKDRKVAQQLASSNTLRRQAELPPPKTLFAGIDIKYIVMGAGALIILLFARR